MWTPEPRVAFRRLVREFERRRVADEAAQLAVRERLPEAVRLLVDRHGARRVVLFGSLATGLFHHARSDVDFAVLGLDFAALADARRDVEAVLGREVDLVALEDASPALCREVAERGEFLHGA